jgi:hypothetical protein
MFHDMELELTNVELSEEQEHHEKKWKKFQQRLTVVFHDSHLFITISRVIRAYICQSSDIHVPIKRTDHDSYDICSHL